MAYNQKDTKRTKNKSKGHSNPTNFLALLDKPFYDFATKKTEKIVTALYYVSDCMEENDPMREKLRLLGVDLLSFIYLFSSFDQDEKQEKIQLPLSLISEIISLLKVAYMTGFISENNALILQDELLKLANELKEDLDSEKNYLLSLNTEMFQVPLTTYSQEKKNTTKAISLVKDSATNNYFYKGHKLDVSFMNDISPLEKKVSDRPLKTVKRTPAERKNRREKILEIVKKKKEVSIKDIHLAYPSCSQKTILRELKFLISKGQIKKTGNKRWTKYLALS